MDTASLGIAAPLASVMEDTIPFLTPMLCKMKLRLQALAPELAVRKERDIALNPWRGLAQHSRS
jgi:hypothetical protein